MIFNISAECIGCTGCKNEQHTIVRGFEEAALLQGRAKKGVAAGRLCSKVMIKVEFRR